MQGRERHQRLKRLDDGVVDEHRAGKGLAAMDDPVPDGGELASLLMLAQPRDKVHQRLLVPHAVAGAPGHFVEIAPPASLTMKCAAPPSPS